MASSTVSVAVRSESFVRKLVKTGGSRLGCRERPGTSRTTVPTTTPRSSGPGTALPPTADRGRTRLLPKRSEPVVNPLLTIGTLLLLIELPLLFCWIGVTVGSRYHRPLWRFFKPLGLSFAVTTATANLLRALGFGQQGEENWQTGCLILFFGGVAIIMLSTMWPSERHR